MTTLSLALVLQAVARTDNIATGWRLRPDWCILVQSFCSEPCLYPPSSELCLVNDPVIKSQQEISARAVKLSSCLFLHQHGPPRLKEGE